MSEAIKLQAVDILDAHDRLQHIRKYSESVAQGIQDCINNRPPQFGNLPFYIFAHGRTISYDERKSYYRDDFHKSLLDPTYKRKYHTIEEVPSNRIVYMPRLRKPKAEPNSMLFKYYPLQDVHHIKWILPPQETWSQYQYKMLTADETIYVSIQNYLHKKDELEALEEDDLSDDKINAIYQDIANTFGHKAIFKPIYD